MSNFQHISSKFFKSKLLIFVYFLIVNLPLLIVTFNTTNWSDDSGLTNLLAVKAKFSPILPLLFEPTGGHEGGHFAPIYNLINILITYISTCPVFFHFIVMLCYIATAFFLFLIVRRLYKDDALGILAGTLFAINYYIGFKALNWNTFHSHATNVLTGIVGIYFLIKYLQEKRVFSLVVSMFFLILTIFNYESGFVFLPILLIITLFSLFKKQIDLKKSVLIVLAMSLVMALFPIGAYLKTGKVVPLSYRFSQKGIWSRSIQGYLFHANDLFIKSTGFSILYNKLVFDQLKENPQLKKTIIELVRENKKFNLQSLPLKFIVTLLMLSIFTILLFIFVMVVIFTRIRKQTYLFIAAYGCLFLIYPVIFYRIDVANAISIASSIIIADLIISFLRDKKIKYRRAGMVILGLYLFVTSWAIMDRFDDCYRKSFFGLSRVAISGPDKIYQDINKKIGRFAKDGIILFTHDYRRYHKNSGFERIGDMVSLRDFVCLNASAYYRDLMKTDIPNKYRDKTFGEFYGEFVSSPNYKKVIVSSIEEASNYLRKNRVDASKVEAIYLAEDYKVIKLNR